MPASPLARVEDLVLRYVPLRALGPASGEGLLPRTFLALDRGSGDQVVVALSSDLPRDEAAVAFARELTAARGARGRVRAAVLDGGVLADRAWVASAWVPGVDLGFLLAKGKAGINLALPVLWQVSAALADLHGRGLVHGDLHPRNVRIGPGGEVILVGYAPAPVGGPLKTPAADQPVLRYAPPEFLAEGTCSAAGDVYSLGLLVYELFAGRPLLAAGSAQETLARQQGLAGELSQAMAGTQFPGRLALMVRRMLAWLPADRPGSGAELHDALVGLVPDWTASDALVRVPADRLEAAVAAARERHLKDARTHSKGERPLAVASHLLTFAEGAEGAGDEVRAEFVALLEEALWRTFRESPGPEAHREQAAAEVVAYLLFRAAAAAKDSNHGEIASLRLAVAATDASQLARHGTAEPPAPEREKRVEGLRAFLARHPADARGLLWLAALTPGFKAKASTRPARMRADLLVLHRIPSAAILHLATELAARPADPNLLRELKGLVERALVETPPPAPAVSVAHGNVATGLGDRALDEILQPTAAPGPGAGKPPATGRPLRVGLPPPDQPLTMEDAQIVFDAAQALAQDGMLGPAVDGFHRLLTAGEFERRRFHSMASDELRHLVWVALMEAPARGAQNALLRLAELVRLLGLTRLVNLVQSLWLTRAAPSQIEAEIEGLVGQDPWSIPLLSAAARCARDPRERARFLASVAREASQIGAIVFAARVAAEARGLAADLEPVRAATATVAEAQATANQAAAAFKELELAISTGLAPAAAITRCETFLRSWPTHLPALFRRAELAEKVGDRPRAASLHWQLATTALIMGELDLARRHLRGALSAQPEDDDALLYLACLDHPPPPRSGRILDLKIAVLRRENLPGVAVLQVRKALVGGVEDLALHQQLVELSREAGQDPAPHLLAQGMIRMAQGQGREARSLFEAAVDSSPDPEHVIGQLLHTPGVAAIVPPDRLEALRKRRR